MSFTDYGIQNLRAGSAAPNFVGLENYIDVIASQLAIPNFNFSGSILYNLVVGASATSSIHVILGVRDRGPAEHVKGLWFKRFYRALFILPVVIPPIIVATVWRNMFDADYGAINQLLAVHRRLGRHPGRRASRSTGCARSRTRSRSSRCRSPTSRC